MYGMLVYGILVLSRKPEAAEPAEELLPDPEPDPEPEAGVRLIGGAGALAPAGRPEADLWPMFPHWEKLCSEKCQQIWNVDFGCENISCRRRNSVQNPLIFASWGPSFDSFPDFQNFAKFHGSMDPWVLLCPK